MNRREVLLRAVGCLGGLALPGEAMPSNAARAWHVRVTADGPEPRRLASEVLVQGPAGADVPVLLHNDTGRRIELRSARWDRDVALPPHSHASCRMDLSCGSAAFSAGDGVTQVRGVLRPRAPGADDFDADYDMDVRASTWPGIQGEPLRVRQGQRIRFRFFNADEERAVSLHLPGHEFEVLALDDLPLPRPVRVEHLQLAPGERIDTRMAMHRPGSWVLGSLSRVDQQAGLKRLVVYDGACGRPVACAPAPVRFGYAQLGITVDPTRRALPAAQEVVLDAAAWERRILHAERGRRQRLVFSNMTRQLQVVALRGHLLEVCQVGSAHLRALYKDCLALPPFARVAVQFLPRSGALELLRL